MTTRIAFSYCDLKIKPSPVALSRFGSDGYLDDVPTGATSLLSDFFDFDGLANSTPGVLAPFETLFNDC
ncbi:MAG: hypothetical protein WB778_04165 [Thermoplasmata archaeon]